MPYLLNVTAKKWITQLIDGLQNTLVPVLQTAGMISPDLFESKLSKKPWGPILEVADFNSIIALSQEHQVPVYALTGDQVDQQGAVWEQTKKSMGVFFEAFSHCADKIFALTS